MSEVQTSPIAPPKKRRLGKSGLEVSEIGMGAWPLGDEWGEVVSVEEGVKTIHAAIDTGVNFIDTADIYGAGRSERIVGQALKDHPSDDILVATKMGQWPEWEDEYDVMERHAAASLRRLKRETLDLVQLHCIDEKVLYAGRVFENLDRLKEKGLIRHYGVSVETIDEGLYCIAESDAVSLQVIFNIFRQKPLEILLPAAEKYDVGIIARVPLASGLLTAKMFMGYIFEEGDHRKFNAHGNFFNVGETFAGVEFSDGVQFADQIEEMVLQDGEATMVQKALRWILDHPMVTCAIPGMRNVEQALENIGASSQPSLSQESHDKLRGYYQHKIHDRIRGAY